MICCRIWDFDSIISVFLASSEKPQKFNPTQLLGILQFTLQRHQTPACAGVRPYHHLDFDKITNHLRNNKISKCPACTPVAHSMMGLTR